MRARLEVLSPSSLCRRRVAEDFHVVAVTAVKEFGFDTASQTVGATLPDAREDTAMLVHPFRVGALKVLNCFSTGWKRISPSRSASSPGQRKPAPRGLMFSPTALVFQDGTSRQIVQPWVDCLVSLICSLRAHFVPRPRRRSERIRSTTIRGNF